MTPRRFQSVFTAVALGLLAGCTGGDPNTTPVSATNHKWFPIGAGSTHELGKATVEGAIACEGCHRADADSFKAVRCDTCHKHPEALTPRLHLGVMDFAVDTSSTNDPALQAELRGASCYRCHPTGDRQAFSHAGIYDQCAECHAETTPFAALPKPNFTHRDVGGADCGGCHVKTSWSEVSGAQNAFDPTRSFTVDALQPKWVGTTMISVTPDPQTITLPMNHAATAVDAGVLFVCGNCHAQADQGQYYPGVMHWSLANLGVPQPKVCSECHRVTEPNGFVGTLDARRTPSTGEMRHDAVLWSNGAPTTTRVVTADCHVCHEPPDEVVDTTWTFADGKPDAGAVFHSRLTAEGLPQPAGCLDCHANTRPVTPLMTAGLLFDHGSALGECKDCHASTTQWSGGKYHTTTAPTPSTCLPCHDGERPTSITGWLGNYTTSPFDYVTNAAGDTHGAGQDCVVCHAGPGSGMWGVNQNWQRGDFQHTPTSVAATTCITCHTTQRPDRLTPAVDAGYDHATNGTGDCRGCHQATVTRNRYISLLPIPGGDWRGGQSYPGSTPISAPGSGVQVQSTTLTRTGPLVTGLQTTWVSLSNPFLHTSAAIPAAVAPGSATMPDNTTCWHCHTSTGTTVTAYANGKFHASLTNYRVNPDAGVTGLPQPTSCNDCHSTMRPPNIVSRTDAGTWLRPMDHSTTFVGGSVTGVAAMDCSSCHRTPGFGPTQWSDGVFHVNVPTGGTPSDCISCHFPLVTTPQADVTFPDAGTPSTFTMKHRSSLVTLQACATCHTTALSRSLQTPTATTQWKPGAYHGSLTSTTQPATCLDCHSLSDPTGATQGTVVYTMPQGGTATNGGQWMNHTDATVAGKDCSTCHGADAKVTGSAWNKATAYHAKVATVTACAKCHGLTNGKGTVVGTNNNMPAGLIDSATTTTASPAPAGTKDQIAHTDSNVTGKDCNFCHTQVGPSTVMGVQGKEWTKATFHNRFSSANPLVINGTTGRCSNCHMNVKPGASFTQFDHAQYTATSTSDCSSCHSWPGTSTTTPNWLGATGAHAATGPTATSTLDCNTCHGQNGNSTKHLTVPAAQHYGGITNGNKCTSCHINFAGFKGTTANLLYGHTNATANAGAGCSNCHVFASQLYTTLTTTPPLSHPTATGGHQFSQTFTVTGTFNNDSFTSNHTNAGLTRCGACHQYAATTSTTNVWTFKHRPSNPGISNSQSTSGCNMCH
jgi:hypothetical protein